MKAYEQVKMMKQVITFIFIGAPMLILVLIYSACIWVFSVLTGIIWHGKTGFYIQYKAVLVDYLPPALIKSIYKGKLKK